MEDVEEIFDKIRVKDIVVYNVMVEGLSRIGEIVKRVVEMYVLM